ncbi:MAG TPA: N-acetylglucosamine-6-phosphate deacetylase [Steroidobacteraceae bacterium]|jgi:N-acetylglucosamine-6-phosphate deacetylase|nr:N-acetylglucosamine-6-phosphate deacetylase [Steroidobacteraceae bacterium]
MRTALVNGRIMAGSGLLSGQTLLLSGARIEALVDPKDERCAGAVTVDLEGQLLLPGFIDVQVNGGGGVLFNDDPSPDSIRAIGAAHRRFGTTGFLPTLISDDLDTIGRAIAAVQSALGAAVPGVLGIHIEGPFLNWARRGVHDSKHLRPLDTSLVALLSGLKAGRTVLTLAPEMTTPEVIAQLTAAGILVSAGHSEASFAETTAAIAQGLRGFTHLFNAMARLEPRDPGIVGAALYDQDTWCGIIVDGHHVDPVMLKLALRCKRHSRFMLVTDAMPAVGSPEPTFVLQGRTIRVVDGICRDENGTLAGTALDMAGAVRNAVSLLGLDIVEAARMASEYPAEFLGLGHELGRIAPGYRANLVLMDHEFNVQKTWIEGLAD